MDTLASGRISSGVKSNTRAFLAAGASVRAISTAPLKEQNRGERSGENDNEAYDSFIYMIRYGQFSIVTWKCSRSASEMVSNQKISSFQ